MGNIQTLWQSSYQSLYLDADIFSESFRHLFQTSFEELNPETLSNQVMKYAKTVMQLEKGLPPNSVVPILKEKVEGMRHKVFTQLNRLHTPWCTGHPAQPSSHPMVHMTPSSTVFTPSGAQDRNISIFTVLLQLCNSMGFNITVLLQ